MQALKTTSMTIKWKLAHLMFDADIKTKDLSAKTGLHPNTISKLKAHREMPSRLDKTTLDKLCEALNCTPGDLLVYEEASRELAAK